MSGSTLQDSGSNLPPTLVVGTIGCVCGSDEVLDAVAAGLLAAGVPQEALHLGATDANRAGVAAQRLGIIADVQPDDPLRDFVQLPSDGAARRAIDRAGVLGGAVGAAAGVAIGFTPVGLLIAATPATTLLSNAAFYFVIGAIVGSVLGAALAPQRSTHAAFRLIDGMYEGGYALVVLAPRERHDDLQRVLEQAGATGVTRV